jgi:sec1 family domain-containing protein 1
VDVGNQTFSEVIVFVVGGGCYTEYFNLQELRRCSVEARNTLRNVVYGSTDLLDAEGFLQQLAQLR